MSWMFLAISGYLLLAVEAIITKLLLVSRIKNWQMYSFYIGIFSFFSLVFLPFADWQGKHNFLISLYSGLFFFVSLVFLYRALELTSASRVYVLYGATSTLFSFLLARIFLKDIFSFHDIFGLIFLILGSGFISFKFYKGKFFNRSRDVIIAGFLMGISLVLLKAGYNHQNFWGGYVYSRIGIGLGALLFLIFPFYRKVVIQELKVKNDREKAKSFLGVSFAKSLSGLGTILVNYSISLGSVAIVSALVATQFLFTFFLAVFLGIYFKSIRERVNTGNIIYKFIGVVLIILGVMAISF